MSYYNNLTFTYFYQKRNIRTYYSGSAKVTILMNFFVNKKIRQNRYSVISELSINFLSGLFFLN